MKELGFQIGNWGFERLRMKLGFFVDRNSWGVDGKLLWGGGLKLFDVNLKIGRVWDERREKELEWEGKQWQPHSKIVFFKLIRVG